MNIFILLALGVVTGGIGAFISEKKGRRHIEGFLLGFFFGLIGILIALILPKQPAGPHDEYRGRPLPAFKIPLSGDGNPIDLLTSVQRLKRII